MLGLSVEVISQKNEKVEMGVYGFFEKKKSWVKKRHSSDKLLNHEQKHFDLCEVYRRKFIKKLETQNPIDNKKFSEQMQETFNLIFAAYTQEQSRYDRETEHSLNEEEQERWDKYIEEQLSKLEKYDKIAASLVIK